MMMQELAAKNNAKTISTQHRYVTLKKFDIGSCLPLLSILRLVQLEKGKMERKKRKERVPEGYL